MNRKSKYKDMDRYAATARRWKHRYYSKTAYSANYGLPWTEEDIQKVMEHKVTDYELSMQIGRSVNSIQKKRWEEKHAVPTVRQ